MSIENLIKYNLPWANLNVNNINLKDINGSPYKSAALYGNYVILRPGATGSGDNGQVVTSWADVHTRILATSGMLNVIVDDSLGVCQVDDVTDCNHLVQFYPYNNNTAPPTLSILPGAQLINPCSFSGPMTVDCQSQVLNSILLDSGSILRVLSGCTISLNANATISAIDVKAGESLIIGEGDSGYLTNGSNPTIGVVNVNDTGTLIMSNVRMYAGTPNDNISGSAFAILIYLYDASVPIISFSQTLFLGSITTQALNFSQSVKYDDVSPPSFGANNVQSALDGIKSLLNNTLACTDVTASDVKSTTISCDKLSVGAPVSTVLLRYTSGTTQAIVNNAPFIEANSYNSVSLVGPDMTYAAGIVTIVNSGYFEIQYVNSWLTHDDYNVKSWVVIDFGIYEKTLGPCNNIGSGAVLLPQSGSGVFYLTVGQNIRLRVFQTNTGGTDMNIGDNGDGDFVTLLNVIRLF